MEDEPEMFKIFAQVEFNGRILYSKKLSGDLSEEDLRNFSGDVVVTKRILPDGIHPVTVTYQRYLPDFAMYEDCQFDEIENGDRVKIVVDVASNDSVSPIEVESAEMLSERSTPINQPPEVQTPKGDSKLTKHGFTKSTVPEDYHQFMFPDSARYPIQEAIEINKHCDEIRKFFVEEHKVNSKFYLIREHLIQSCGDWLMGNCQRKNFPSPYEKARMAFSIWYEFPFFGGKDKCDLPFLHIFDPVMFSGFIQNYVANQRRQLKAQEHRLDDRINHTPSPKPNRKGGKKVSASKRKYSVLFSGSIAEWLTPLTLERMDWVRSRWGEEIFSCSEEALSVFIPPGSADKNPTQVFESR